MHSEYKKETLATYDRIAREYHASLTDVRFWEKEIDILAGKLGVYKKILDVGCGTGRDSALFLERGFEYLGIDASEGMLDVASQLYPNAAFLKMDFTDLSFADKTFDAFWAAASVVHVPKRDIRDVLRELRRILKLSGVGFISVKSKENIEESMVADERRGGMHRFFAFYDREEFKSILEETGFDVVEIREHEKSGDSTTHWIGYFVKLAG